MFEEGSTMRTIIETLANALDFILKRKDIIVATGQTVQSIASALNRLKKLGTVINATDDPTLPWGYWRLVRLYRKIRHTKRINGTSQSKKQREWNCDCEATSEGFVPVIEFGNKGLPPYRPSDKDTKAYANILNPKLAESMLLVLSRNNISLKPGMTSIDTTCTPRFFPPPKYCVEGTEWLDEISGTKFDNGKEQHIVEVVFQSDTGELYPPGPGDWMDFFIVEENEFE